MPSPIADVIARCASGELAPPLALVEILASCEDVNVAQAWIAEACVRARAAPLRTLASLARERAADCVRIVRMMQAQRRHLSAPRDRVEHVRRLFDECVALSEESSVAWYSLGCPELLRRATGEVVRWLDDARLLGEDRAILQIGCGVGRFEEALAHRVREAHGVDVSPRMIETARRRCAALRNVVLRVVDGVSLAPYDDARFDLVYAVDTFPYLVATSPAVVAANVREAVRVLRSGGDLAIFGYSYRRDPGRDRRDIDEIATLHDLDVRVLGAAPFTGWDGAVFHLRKRG